MVSIVLILSALAIPVSAEEETVTYTTKNILWECDFEDYDGPATANKSAKNDSSSIPNGWSTANTFNSYFNKVQGADGSIALGINGNYTKDVTAEAVAFNWTDFIGDLYVTYDLEIPGLSEMANYQAGINPFLYYVNADGSRTRLVPLVGTKREGSNVLLTGPKDKSDTASLIKNGNNFNIVNTPQWYAGRGSGITVKITKAVDSVIVSAYKGQTLLVDTVTITGPDNANNLKTGGIAFGFSEGAAQKDQSGNYYTNGIDNIKISTAHTVVPSEVTTAYGVPFINRAVPATAVTTETFQIPIWNHNASGNLATVAKITGAELKVYDKDGNVTSLKINTDFSVAPWNAYTDVVQLNLMRNRKPGEVYQLRLKGTDANGKAICSPNLSAYNASFVDISDSLICYENHAGERKVLKSNETIPAEAAKVILRSTPEYKDNVVLYDPVNNKTKNRTGWVTSVGSLKEYVWEIANKDTINVTNPANYPLAYSLSPNTEYKFIMTSATSHNKDVLGFKTDAGGADYILGYNDDGYAYVKMFNISKANAPYVLIDATYDEDGLIDVELLNVPGYVTRIETKTLTEKPDMTGAVERKAFIWNNLTDLTPLLNCISTPPYVETTID